MPVLTEIVKIKVTSVGSIESLRTTAGEYTNQQVSLTSYYAGGTTGGGTFVWDADSTAPDDGGVTIAIVGVSAGRWVRLLDGFVTPEMFGAVGDGVGDDTSALRSVGVFGGEVRCNNKYLVSSSILFTTTRNTSFILSSDSEIFAGTGFPANVKLIQPSCSGVGKKFIFKGGLVDGRNMPLGQTGFAPDLLYVASVGFETVEVENSKFVCNDTLLGADSGDSCLFIAGSDYIKVVGSEFIGAPDAGIYISANAEGTLGRNAVISGNKFKHCGVAYIAKREFQNQVITGNIIDLCNSGISTGGYYRSNQHYWQKSSGYWK